VTPRPIAPTAATSQNPRGLKVVTPTAVSVVGGA
jgi:hypothetical protein